MKALVVGHLTACLAAAYLLYIYPRDPVVVTMAAGIGYNHGIKPLANSLGSVNAPGISWNVLKVATFVGFVYGMYKEYYDLAAVMGYSFLSKFYPMAADQVTPVMILLYILVRHRFMMLPAD